MRYRMAYNRSRTFSERCDQEIESILGRVSLIDPEVIEILTGKKKQTEESA